MRQPETPFDSVESAHEYIHLLIEALDDGKKDIDADVVTASSNGARRLEALRLVQYKLGKLEQHLQISSRLLNDLRTLRRLLLEERMEPALLAKRTGTHG